MSGPVMTATVPSTVQSTDHSSFYRSHSTPDLLSGISHPRPNHAGAVSTREFLNLKSLPSLPVFDVSSFELDLDFDFDTSFSVGNESTTPRTNGKITVTRAEKQSEGFSPRLDKMGRRRKSLLGRPHSWLPTSKSSPDVRQSVDEKEKTSEDGEPGSHGTDSPGLLDPSSAERPRKVSGSLASFARRSWISTSRSPSPSPNSNSEAADYMSHESSSSSSSRERSSSIGSGGRLSRLSRKRPVSTIDGDGSKSSDSLAKLGQLFAHRSQQQPAVISKGSVNHDADSTTSSVASMAPPATNSQLSHVTSDDSNTSMQDASVMRQARDPLWSVFKNLESDFSKYQSKTAPLKMNLIRSALIPFLKNFAFHPSNKKLQHEDLERRANILNKWWTALLEMLDGRSQLAVAGVDRPALLEATTMLMMRAEWRQSTPSFNPLVDRNPRERVKRKNRSHSAESESDGSLSSADSDFVAESAEHNVRTMFITNLSNQMAIIVDKLSQRHAPLSLVNFAGKACAYAFFFAPGIAEVLVRLWSLTPDLIRRASDELRLPRRSKGESDDIVALFPSNLHDLGWSSVKTMSDSLRQPAQLPLAAAKIAWHGPWVARWRGRDTDLFFLFCKYYYILAEEFIPSELPLVEKGRAPAFVLVSAQILASLDSTIHRQAAVESMFGPPLADAIHGGDASAMALPVAPNNNVMKGMSENRLVMLLKDFLSASSVAFADARHTFAETFMALMKAAAKKTSQYDHTACFTLCDFLEESLVTYEGFVDVNRPTLVYIDWTFWFDVCQKIMESNNTMSEIRVLSLIFSIWDAVANDQARKEAICFDWLLTEETFDKLFNNWCPMVRAYFMRLLCWRICRDAGNANGIDAKIYMTVSTRLKKTWSHYLWLRQTAESEGKFPPSTAPSYPTPGKRFMIIRSEMPVAQAGFTVGFDSFSTSLTMPNSTHPAVLSSEESVDPLNSESPANRKRWSLFGKVLSFSGGNGNDINDLDSLRRETADSRRPPPPPKQSGGTVTPPASDSDSTGSSPTYDALHYVFRFTLSWNAPNTMSPPSRILTRPRLPAPAQSWVNARGGSSSLPLAAGRPPPTRAVSGSASTGLVESAKNADPSEAASVPDPTSTTFEGQGNFDSASPIDRTSDEYQSLLGSTTSTMEMIIQPAKPLGTFATGAKYAGRALAEWGLVVIECNSFVDRRRDEGVLGLSEVEVPILGVEGFRKLG